MSGREAGYCAGFGRPGYANVVPGRGFGMGFQRGRGGWGCRFAGGGRGWRHMYYATGQPSWMRGGGYHPVGAAVPDPTPDPEFERRALQNRADALRAELDQVQKRLTEVESERPSE